MTMFMIMGLPAVGFSIFQHGFDRRVEDAELGLAHSGESEFSSHEFDP